MREGSRATPLGDAAHPALHYLPQGAGMALEDAVTLGDALRVHGGDWRCAFARLRVANVARSARVVLSSRERMRSFHARGVERLARNDLRKDRTPLQRCYDALEWRCGWQVENGVWRAETRRL